MSEFKARAHGVAKQAMTTLKGQTGIYATLAKEHAEVSSLLLQAIQATTAKRREDLIEKIRIELMSHSFAEERTLYDACLRYEEVSGKTKENIDEHDSIERLLIQVGGAADKTSQTTALEILHEAFEFHVRVEEDELFPQAQELLPVDHESEMNARFTELKEQEKRRLEADALGWASGALE